MKNTFRILISPLIFFPSFVFSFEKEPEGYSGDIELVAINNEVIAQAKQVRLFYLFYAQLWKEIEIVARTSNDAIGGRITEKDVIKKIQVTLAKLRSLKLLVSKLSLPEEIKEDQDALIQTCKDAEQIIKNVLKNPRKNINNQYF